MAFYEFTGMANGTPLPPALIVENGTFNIVFGQLAPSGTFADPFWICTQESNVDSVVFATHRLNPDGGGMILRCIDKDNMIICSHNSDSTLTIIERSGGVDSVIASAPTPAFNSVKEQRYTAACKGDDITFSVGGEAVVTATTSFNNTATKHGIRITSTAGVGIFRMQIADAEAPVFNIITAGQSNISGRGTNNQVYTGTEEATLFSNTYEYVTLTDPYDMSIGQIDLISADSTPAGSWLPKFCTDWSAGQGRPVSITPCPRGGTTISRWQKTDSVRVGGLNLYESLVKRISYIALADVLFLEIGESDAEDVNGTTAADYKTLLKQFVQDVFDDTGVKTFMIPLHTITQAGFNGNGTTTGQVAIRAAQLEAGAESNHLYVAPTLLTDIDISGGDGLHFKSDGNLSTVGSRTYIDFADYLNNLNPSDKALLGRVLQSVLKSILAPVL